MFANRLRLTHNAMDRLDPECVTAAGPPNIIVTFAYGISFPPVTQTCRVETGGLVGSKGAVVPFPVIRLAVQLIESPLSLG